MLQADPVAVSTRAKKRGLPQVSEASRFRSGGRGMDGEGKFVLHPRPPLDVNKLTVVIIRSTVPQLSRTIYFCPPLIDFLKETPE